MKELEQKRWSVKRFVAPKKRCSIPSAGEMGSSVHTYIAAHENVAHRMQSVATAAKVRGQRFRDFFCHSITL